jgi:SagB-type dehydrogenase family enzyme
MNYPRVFEIDHERRNPLVTTETGRQFMKETMYRYLETSDQRKGLPQPLLELGHDEEQPVIELPAPADLPTYPCDLKALVESRRSARRYTGQALTLDELSFLLWCTQGVKETVDRHATLRTVPSAGARHAFETYLLVNNVEGLTPGLYRFLALSHQLVQIKAEAGLADRMAQACLDQSHVKRSAVTFFWVAVPYRMTWRYDERGYRYLHLDAGHVCQNLYLAAEALGAGVCAIAAFEDETLNRLLEIDGEEQFVIYLATVGRRER